MCVCCVYLLHLGQLFARVLIVPQVLLVPHQDDGDVGTEVLHLGRPLLGDVFCPGGGRRRRRRRKIRRRRSWTSGDGGEEVGRVYKKGQAVQRDDAELSPWWMALQTAPGKNVSAALILFLIKSITAFKHARVRTRFAALNCLESANTIISHLYSRFWIFQVQSIGIFKAI